MQLSKLRSSLCLAVAGALIMTGCTTVNPYTGEEETSGATIGTGVGALGGAAIGALAGDSKGALIGAGVGAALGGGIGYYMDVQETKLRQQLRSTGVSVTRSGNDIILNMPNELTFGVDQTDLSSRAQQVLNSVALVLKEYEKTNVHVFGYTDSTGAENYNLRLSQVRAAAVSDYLVRTGVDGNRLSSTGRGEANPIASNSTESGRAQNRRVEIYLSPRQ